MKLSRAINPMPETIRLALSERGLMTAYEARPDYQRNDYLGWIARARLSSTQEKRLRQMLEELARGDVYMNMAWRPRKRI
nr:YdeI/OmpD-associated family protein [Pseudaminobacter salicylatoxidans]